MNVGVATVEIKYSGAACGDSLRVRFVSSRLAAGFVLLAGGATLALVLATPLPAWVRVFAALWIGAGMLDACRVHALRVARRAAREIVVSGSREIEVCDAAGDAWAGAILDGSFVAPWLTIILWRPRGARFARTILVVPDALSGEEFRRLRILLRWA